MNTKSLIISVASLIAATNVFATVINFDNAPITGNNLGSFYSGVLFGNSEVVTTSSAQFPAHSGNQLLFGNSMGNATMTIIFTHQQQSLSFYYTALDGFTATVYHGAKVIGTFDGASSGQNNFFSVTDASADISYIVLKDKSGVGQSIALDDLNFTNSVPASTADATGTLGLLGVAALGLWAFRRQTAVQH